MNVDQWYISKWNRRPFVPVGTSMISDESAKLKIIVCLCLYSHAGILRCPVGTVWFSVARERSALHQQTCERPDLWWLMMIRCLSHFRVAKMSSLKLRFQIGYFIYFGRIICICCRFFNFTFPPNLVLEPVPFRILWILVRHSEAAHVSAGFNPADVVASHTSGLRVSDWFRTLCLNPEQIRSTLMEEDLSQLPASLLWTGVFKVIGESVFVYILCVHIFYNVYFNTNKVFWQ